MTVKLYKEVDSESGRELTKEEQETGVYNCKSTKCVEATDNDIASAMIYFQQYGCCNRHLFYDVEGVPYDIRICGICGKSLGFI